MTIVGSASSGEESGSTRTKGSIVASTIPRAAAMIMTQTRTTRKTGTHDLRSSRDCL